MWLLNPKDYKREFPDERSGEIMKRTIEFFEQKGKEKLKEDDHKKVWYQDFLDFQKKERIFSTVLTPSAYGEPPCRWDTNRISAFAEILGFYGLSYWYTYQVSALGLAPIWMGKNEEQKKKAAELLKKGEIFAFGLSEKEHGADIYSSEMKLHPKGDGSYTAKGSKYYIGNGNEAALVSTFAKMADSGDYVFFTVSSKHPQYKCVKNVVDSQNYVAEYECNDVPITEADILDRGRSAWDASLNTVNVCKPNLGWASIGICTHSFYEALRHASRRRLFDHQVTDFPHVRSLLMDAYSRLLAMKLFSHRAIDYVRSASPDDRRYLLYSSIVKMKVTSQGEDVINHLWDVIAAKGFEKDMYFEMAARDIRALPKLEGTVHVNMALCVKFMPNFLFNPGAFPELSIREDAACDRFMFTQGATKGLGKIQFHDPMIALESLDLPNVAIFREQTNTLKMMLMTATPDEKQREDIDFLLLLGELFTLVAYGQLIIENAKLRKVDNDAVDRIFDVLIRDFSRYALALYSKPSATDAQMEHCLKMIRKPQVDPARFDRVWNQHIVPLQDAYEMNK